MTPAGALQFGNLIAHELLDDMAACRLGWPAAEHGVALIRAASHPWRQIGLQVHDERITYASEILYGIVRRVGFHADPPGLLADRLKAFLFWVVTTDLRNVKGVQNYPPPIEEEVAA
ncbi:MAG: hypothetical protein SF069_03085 [Phycisphaerae bacterium]|nr:hypothetical protein [Phycisphaerae bacterium]